MILIINISFLVDEVEKRLTAKCVGIIEEHTATEHELLLLEERNEAYTKSKSIAKLEQELNILLHIRKERITAEQLNILDSGFE
ncbi:MULTISPECIES: hypothetical protein [Bacillus]|uniref:hypothetical protein n=1 Tax=Bacillus TaxID=1386 RepID=UPI001BB40497|nr:MULTISPECIES: hypothetical protein [Bacillus]